MSRIGNKPILLPNEVKFNIKEEKLLISGPKGDLYLNLHKSIKIKKEENLLYVERVGSDKFIKGIHGLFRTLINNMIIGVTKGYQKILEIKGVGYRAKIKNNQLYLLLGYSHPIYFDIPKDIKIVIENKDTKIILSSHNKELLGETAAKIRFFRKPEPYHEKGIKYSDEKVRRKDVKSSK